MGSTYVIVLVCVLFACNLANAAEKKYDDLGCWRNEIPHMLTNLEGNFHLDGQYRNRADPIRKCYLAARDAEFDVFALGNKGKCWAGIGEDNTYMAYGQVRNCPRHGKGRHGVMHVYEIKSLQEPAVQPTVAPVAPEKRCELTCSGLLNPVCGTDGKTYSNHCELDIATCRTNGVVKEKSIGQCVDGCERTCSGLLNPVCGTDGKTYSNHCELDIATCQTNGAVLEKSIGQCLEDDGTAKPTEAPEPTHVCGSGACEDGSEYCSSGVCYPLGAKYDFCFNDNQCLSKKCSTWFLHCQ